MSNFSLTGRSELQFCSCNFTHGNPLETKNSGFSSTLYVKGTATGTVSTRATAPIIEQIASLASGNWQWKNTQITTSGPSAGHPLEKVCYPSIPFFLFYLF